MGVNGVETVTFNSWALSIIRNATRGKAFFKFKDLPKFVEKNPQIIITVNPKFFLDNQAYKNVSAVKTGNVYTIESNSLSVPGPRFPNGIREIATLIYPEKFENVNNK